MSHRFFGLQLLGSKNVEHDERIPVDGHGTS
jgi:hypothetical protein